MYNETSSNIAGWTTCPNCGSIYPLGTYHACNHKITVTWPNPETELDKLTRIEDKLDELIDLLKKRK